MQKMMPPKRKRLQQSLNGGSASSKRRHEQASCASSSASLAEYLGSRVSQSLSDTDRDDVTRRTNTSIEEHNLYQDSFHTLYSSQHHELSEDCVANGDRPEVIMALDLTKSTLGCAYFAEQTLFISDDIEMSNMDVVEHFLTQIEPTVVLISNKAPQNLYSCLDTHPDIRSHDLDEPRTLFQTLPSADFLFSTAKDRIVALDSCFLTDTQAAFSTAASPDDRQNSTSVEVIASHREAVSFKYIRWGTQISFDNRNSIACAGAILSDITHRRAAQALRGNDQAISPFEVVSVRHFSLANSLCIDAETLASLRIFHAETHPNAPASNISPFLSKGKESLSVYGLFQKLASTTQGRSSLRKIFLRPTTDLEVIRERQLAISVLLRQSNAPAVEQAISLLRKIPTAKSAIVEIQRGADSTISGKSINRSVWVTLKRFTANTLKLRDLITNLDGTTDNSLIRNILRGIDQSSLFEVGSLIHRIVDFEASSERLRPCVRSGVSDRLDELKRSYNGMESFLIRVKGSIQREMPSWAARRVKACIVLPHIGFLLVVEQDGETGQPAYEGGQDPQDTWERIYSSGTDGTIAFKNRHMRELDERFGDIYGVIGDLEVEIIHQLATDIMQHETSILVASESCGELDAIVALALGAREYGMALPSMTSAPVLSITEGRHLLQELAVSSFIPNDCILDSTSDGLDGAAATMLLTGPNHSGKSVFIKQVAIIVYLAHVGSYVPAKQATIGLTDKILARIATRETVSSNESAFAIDLRQMTRAIRCSTPQSLVLVDEFGKGTSVDDGAGLMAAVLDHFASLGSQRPRALIATHFHQLLTNGYIPERDGLKCYHMKVQQNPASDGTAEQIIYLFKLCRGHSTLSFGVQCAAMNGVPDSIVQRAATLSRLLYDNLDISEACTVSSASTDTELATAERIARQFIEQCFFKGDDNGPSAPSRAYQDLVCLLGPDSR